MSSHHLFNYKQTKAHRNVWGTAAKALPVSSVGRRIKNNTSEAGSTNTSARPSEMRRCMKRWCLVPGPSVGPLVTSTGAEGKRRCSFIIQTTGCLHVHHPALNQTLLAASSQPYPALRGAISVTSCGICRQWVYGKEWNTNRALGSIPVKRIRVSLLSTPHSQLFCLTSSHGPGNPSWGEIKTVVTQGPQPGPPGVRDQEGERPEGKMYRSSMGTMKL